MGDDCKNWQERAKNTYWSNFKTICFLQILSEGFNEQLVVPEKFVNKLRGKLESSVALIGPSGAIWNVGLTARGEELYFDHGWKEFVEEHSLRENDILLFKYKRSSQLKEKIFDRESQCENEYSYFVRKCEHRMHSSGGERSTATSSRSLLKSNKLKSNRRPVTEEEKHKAIQMANAAVSPTGFTVKMAAGYVYRRFEMTIPGDWAKAYLPATERNFDLALRVKDKTWISRCYQRVKSGRRTILSGKGYRSFVLENQIEEFDVCVFEMERKDDSGKDISFNVSIFRVVEDAIPPSLVSPS
nr:B3 domain-containing protein REM16-like isoform X2 [Ipomoea batatas]GMC85185.1 B3 domain-containing protein REM16-like isoform X2 [Ipomoea batatas]